MVKKYTFYGIQKEGDMVKAKSKIKVKRTEVAAKKGKKIKTVKTKVVKAVKKIKPKKVIKKVVIKKAQKKPVKKVLERKELLSSPSNITPYTLKKDEEYMNPQQLKHFENILKNWKEQLMQRADVTKHNMQDSSSVYADAADRAYQEEEFSRELRTRDRERKLLKKIDEALDRIKENNYGYCDDCGAEIGFRRLEARPTATQCIECKTISELKEKQVGELEE